MKIWRARIIASRYSYNRRIQEFQNLYPADYFVGEGAGRCDLSPETNDRLSFAFPAPPEITAFLNGRTNDALKNHDTGSRQAKGLARFGTGSTMTAFFSFVVALFVALVAIPPLMRGSRKLRLMDEPSARKIHSQAVPRCAGIAIAIGTILPILMWVPLDRAISSYLIGATIVLAFGVWDDIRSLNYKWKFLGQGIAVVIAIQGGVVIEHVPFFGLDPAPAYVAYPLTVLFLLGITNAVNLFDGLDGLAGGCVLLTLSAIGVLAYESGGIPIVLMALATMGSVFGFLRYNTHPAFVFMGDAGSQFLGFTTAVLSILLLEEHHQALNAGLPLLLLGLPILDTLSVMIQRLLEGRSPFSADRNHIHHKILDLAFTQYEAVCIIYIVQALMVCGALAFRYESDTVVITVFALICAVSMLLLQGAKIRGWRMRPDVSQETFIEKRNLWLRKHEWLPAFAVKFVRYAVAGFMIAGALVPVTVSTDLSVLSLSVAGLSIAAIVLLKTQSLIILRMSAYLAAVVAAYLIASWEMDSVAQPWILGSYLLVLTMVLIVAIRVTRRDLFQVTPQDLLILFLALAIPNLSGRTLNQYQIGEVGIMLIVVFYASEFILTRDQSGYSAIRFGSLFSLGMIGIRGVLF